MQKSLEIKAKTYQSLRKAYFWGAPYNSSSSSQNANNISSLPLN